MFRCIFLLAGRIYFKEALTTLGRKQQYGIFETKMTTFCNNDDVFCSTSKTGVVFATGSYSNFNLPDL